MIKYSTPYSSASSGTRIPIGTSDNTTSPPCGINLSPKIYNTWKSVTLYFRESNKLDTYIDGKFTNNLVAPPIFTEVICDKLSGSSIRDIYMRCYMNLAADPVNIPVPQFVDLGLSNIDALDKGASLWTPTIRVGRPMDISYWNAPGYIFVKTIAVGDSVSEKSDYNYKNDFETWRENLEFERQNNASSRPPLDSTTVGEKLQIPKHQQQTRKYAKKNLKKST